MKDYNFGSLIRTDAREEYSETNTIFVTRIQVRSPSSPSPPAIGRGLPTQHGLTASSPVAVTPITALARASPALPPTRITHLDARARASRPNARPRSSVRPPARPVWRPALARVQFYVFEIARNRLGLNDRAHEIAKEEAAKDKEKAEKEKARAEREKSKKKRN